MRYFDSRDASPHARRGDGFGGVAAGDSRPSASAAKPYWDGGLYSNTPLEAVLDDNPRRDSVIFSVNVWQPSGAEPESIWQAMAREKDIRYASRADSHITRQKQIHHLRHVIRELFRHVPAAERKRVELRELASWGCGTTMHVVHLQAPVVDCEDSLKDLDFSAAGIRKRCAAGLADTRRMLELAPWEAPVDPMEAVVEHELPERTGDQPR